MKQQRFIVDQQVLVVTERTPVAGKPDGGVDAEDASGNFIDTRALDP
jgi:hypothetical protein